jgi:hypothetical protein
MWRLSLCAAKDFSGSGQVRFPEETRDLPFALTGAFQAFDILGVHAGHINLIPRIQEYL